MAKKVIVFTAEWCPWCHVIMDFLKKNKIPFEARDIEQGKNAQECSDLSGQGGIPVTVIDGQVVVGYDVQRLKELLEIK